MAATHAAAARFYRAAQKTHRARQVIAALFQRFNARLRIVGEQLGDNIAVVVGCALFGAETDHLLRLQLDRQLGRHLFRSEVKAFAGDRDRYRADQHDGVIVELAVNRFIINTANASAVAVVDAVIDAQRLRNNKVAADHINMRAL